MTPSLAASFRLLFAGRRNLLVLGVLALVTVFVLGSWIRLKQTSTDFIAARRTALAAEAITAAPTYRWGQAVKLRLREGLFADDAFWRARRADKQASPPVTPHRYLHDGWSWHEPGGVWSDGERARLAFAPVVPPVGDVRLSMRARGAVRAPGQVQSVEVRVGDRPVGVVAFDRNNAVVPREVVIPGDLVRAAPILEIVFVVADPVVPYSLGRSADLRRLGIGIAELTLHDTAGDDPAIATDQDVAE